MNNTSYKKEYRRRLRKAAMMLLGGKCARCQEDDYDVLQFDHIQPLWNVKTRPANDEIYHDILKGRTNNLQILCANCHIKKTRDERSYSLNERTLDSP